MERTSSALLGECILLVMGGTYSAPRLSYEDKMRCPFSFVKRYRSRYETNLTCVLF